MRNKLQIGRSLIAFATTLALLSALGVGFGLRGTGAQEAGSESHPAHLHSGTCAELGDVVYPLSNIGSDYQVDGTPSAGEVVGAESYVPVEVSVTTVQAPLADIISGGYALNVHESDANIGNYIACGDVGGPMLGASELAIGLAELNESDYFGYTWFRDNGDGTTTVMVSLLKYADEGEEAEEPAEEAEGTPAESGEAQGAESAVEIADFAFNPQTIEIAVGDTVTWTNNDSTAHTVTQDPSGSGFQSGTIDAGGTFEFTFDTAGEFPYFCEFHPNMTGTVVVS